MLRVAWESTLFAAVKTGGEYIKSIKGNTITTKDGQKEKYNTGMTFVSGGSEITYASAKTKVKAGKSVKVYKQYFKPYKNMISSSDDGGADGAPGGGTDTGNKFGSSTSKIGTAKFRIGYYITNGGIDGDLSPSKSKEQERNIQPRRKDFVPGQRRCRRYCEDFQERQNDHRKQSQGQFLQR